MKNPPLAQLLPSLKKSIIPNPTAKFEKVNSFVKWGKGAGREGVKLCYSIIHYKDGVSRGSTFYKHKQ